MASIYQQKLEINRDERRGLLTPIVTCCIQFTKFEQCLMKQCSDSRLFKLTCKLLAEDYRIDFIEVKYVYDQVYYFPPFDPSPEFVPRFAKYNCREFKDTISFEILDEDSGPDDDEIKGRIILKNLFTGIEVIKDTKEVLIPIHNDS